MHGTVEGVSKQASPTVSGNGVDRSPTSGRRGIRIHRLTWRSAGDPKYDLSDVLGTFHPLVRLGSLV